jgi:hypothetical protein
MVNRKRKREKGAEIEKYDDKVEGGGGGELEHRNVRKKIRIRKEMEKEARMNRRR